MFVSCAGVLKVFLCCMYACLYACAVLGRGFTKNPLFFTISKDKLVSPIEDMITRN